MSADGTARLEARLARALAGLGPAPQATARARRAALAATTLGAPRRRRWRARGAGLLAAAALTAGVGMAASGRIGGPDPSAGAPTLLVPAGRQAAAVLDGGRAWVATAAGGRISRRATAVELSPAGLFAAFGSAGALVATELDGDLRWSVRTAGPVLHIAWAPYPTYIAYIVRRGGSHELHVIWANGRNDRVVAGDVSSVRPRWRPDTSGLVFTRADGGAAEWRREADLVRTLRR